jgi:AraC-like DNA-binding protein
MPKVSLDQWTTLFALAAVQGLFLAIVLFQNKKGNTKATRLLATDILLFSILLLYYVSYWTGFANKYLWVNGWTEPLVFLFGPLTYLYLRELEQPVSRKEKLIHYIPFFLRCGWAIPFIIRYIFGRVEVLRNYFFSYREMVDAVSIGFIVLSNLSLLAYGAVMILFLRRDKSQLNQYATKEEWNKHYWLKKVVWFYAGFAVASVSYWLLAWMQVLRLEYDYLISVAMSAFIYMVGYLGFTQPVIFHGYSFTGNGKTTAAKYARSSLKEDEAKQYLQKLLEIMELEKPYLDSELKIQQLAQRIGLSTHHLSQVINELLDQSYADCINTWRINEAKRLLLSPSYENEKILSIAFDSGFHNKATFNAAFKKYTGMSPSEYKRYHQQILVN